MLSQSSSSYAWSFMNDTMFEIFEKFKNTDIERIKDKFCREWEAMNITVMEIDPFEPYKIENNACEISECW